MARPTKAKAPKGRNGEGDSLTVYFDCSDPAERKALEAARLLATKHGRRKQAIIALLEAVYTSYEQTGELMSASAISSALLAQNSPTSRSQTDFMSTDTIASERRRQHQDQSARVEITSLGGKASAETVGKNFLQSVSGFAAGFFD